MPSILFVTTFGRVPYENLMPFAAIVGMVPSQRRGTAYGLYNAAYGVSWFLGSSLMGWLYGRSPAALAGLSVTAELAAVPLILLVAHMQVAADAAIAQD